MSKKSIFRSTATSATGLSIPSRKQIAILSVLLLMIAAEAFAQIQQPALPSDAQLNWADAEIGVMYSLGMQVFEPGYDFRENWDYHPPLSIFNPKELDTDQWLKSAKSAGATYAVLVAKHCSGFSLWPTKAHGYSVKNTPWRNGEGDIVKDFIASCKEYGIRPGIYASTTANGYLKVNDPGKVVSGDPAEQKKYNEIVKMQLTELWSQYGDLFEIWFDGGILPPEKGGFDVLSVLEKYQPGAVAFGGPRGFKNNIRWVGNENGVAPYPCWSTIGAVSPASGKTEVNKWSGNPDGLAWCPGEADFPLRRNSSYEGGWFWHKGQDDQIRPVEELIDRYCKSVGRNANMLLGIVIDDRGLVPEADVKRLAEFGEAVKKYFSNKLGETSVPGTELTIGFHQPQKVNCVVISEDIKQGEHIRKYQLEGLKGNEWIKIAEGESVGHKRIQNFPGNTYSKIRLTVTEYSREPVVKSFECYYVGEN